MARILPVQKALLFSFLCLFSGEGLSQQPDAGKKAPETPAAPKSIDQQTLKRLIAEKLAAKADPKVIQLLLDQARAGEKRSRDPLANRAAFEKLLIEMEELRKVTARVRKETVGDLVDQSPTEPIEVIVNQTINRLSARVGGDPRGESAGADARLGQPIPEFVDTPLLLEKVNALRDRQTTLRKHLSKDPDKSDVAARKDELVAAMILAQEELLWEAAWPYTDEEVAAIEKAGGAVPREVYLSRLKRGLATVNETVARERASVGRGKPASEFVLYRPADEAASKPIDAQLADLRAHADAWRELAVPFDAAAEAQLSVPESRSD